MLVKKHIAFGWLGLPIGCQVSFSLKCKSGLFKVFAQGKEESYLSVLRNTVYYDEHTGVENKKGL